MRQIAKHQLIKLLNLIIKLNCFQNMIKMKLWMIIYKAN